MHRILRAAILLTLVLSLAPGCSRPVAPERWTAGGAQALPGGTGPRLFYPLDLGNHWRFHRVFTFQSQVIRRSLIDHDLVCVDPIGDREYVVDRVTQIDSTLAGPITYYQWIRSRQDPTGLYEADVNVAEPPACASATELAAGPLPDDAALLDGSRASAIAPLDPEYRDAALRAIGKVRMLHELLEGRGSTASADELTRLSYPMVTGRTWTIRSSPIVFAATVEAMEVLSLPMGRVPAYRVRIDSEASGPQDRILVWYGHSGMVAMFVHVEIPTSSGPLIAEDSFTLEELSVDRGRF